MYCQHCGTDVGESAICPECGKPVLVQNESAEPVQQTAEPVQQAVQKPKRKSIIIIVAVAAVILVALVIGISLSKGSDETASDQTVAAEDVSEGAEPTKKVNPKDTEKTVSEAKTLAENGHYTDAIKLLQTVPQTDDVASLVQEYAEVYLNAEGFGCYWDEDDMSDYHWAYAIGQDSDVHDFSLCVYIHQKKADKSSYGFHLFGSFTGYSGKTEWIFPTSLRIKGDKNDAIDFNSGLNRESDMDGRAMHEWVNFNISQEDFEAICKTANESSSITVRFEGSKYYRDFTLSQKQIEALKVIGAYGSAFNEVYGAGE